MLPGGSILERFVSDHLETLRLNSFFYLAVAADDDSRLQWFQAITTRSGQAAVNRIRFRSAASLAVDDGYFDLNGMQIASLSLDWAPYLVNTIGYCLGPDRHNYRKSQLPVNCPQQKKS